MPRAPQKPGDRDTDRVRERAEQATLRRAVAGEARGRRIEMLDIVRDLVMQERGGVLALDVDHAELGERHVRAGGPDGFEV